VLIIWHYSDSIISNRIGDLFTGIKIIFTKK
jgi:hypothetical protein